MPGFVKLDWLRAAFIQRYSLRASSQCLLAYTAHTAPIQRPCSRYSIQRCSLYTIQRYSLPLCRLSFSRRPRTPCVGWGYHHLANLRPGWRATVARFGRAQSPGGPASTISPNNSLPCLHGPLASPACGGGRGFEICRPTGPPRPLSRETGWPTDRPSCPPPTPRDPTRMTRPTDSPVPVPPPSGWVGPPDRPTLPRAVLLRLVDFQLRFAM